MKKVRKKRKGKQENQNPFARNGIWLDLPANDLLEFRKLMFANSLTITDFLEHVVKELINQNPDMIKFIDTAQRDKLMKQETYTKEGKVNELDFMYFTNGKPLSKTYQYYEGDYKDKASFKFHKIETLFYTNGQEMAQRHWMNNNLIDEKCWDSKGNSKPIEYLKTVKSVQADE